MKNIFVKEHVYFSGDLRPEFRKSLTKWAWERPPELSLSVSLSVFRDEARGDDEKL